MMLPEIKPPTVRGFLISIALALILLALVFYYLLHNRPKVAPITPQPTITAPADSSYRDGRGNLYNSQGELEKPESHNICEGDIPMDGEVKCE